MSVPEQHAFFDSKSVELQGYQCVHFRSTSDCESVSPSLLQIEVAAGAMERQKQDNHIEGNGLHVIQVWEEIPQDTTHQLIRSMPRHCLECKKASGGLGILGNWVQFSVRFEIHNERLHQWVSTISVVSLSEFEPLGPIKFGMSRRAPRWNHLISIQVSRAINQ